MLNHKLKSVKTWITVWAVGMITYIIITGGSENIAICLITTVIGYIVTNVWQKKIYHKADIKEEESGHGGSEQ